MSLLWSRVDTMDKLLIMISSYKRSEVLRFTLQNLCQHTQKGVVDIDVVVGMNKATLVDRDIVLACRKLNETPNFRINYIEFEENIGKADCLNTIVDRYFRDHRYAMCLDSDMWIKGPWVGMLEYLSSVDFDMLGFASQGFWAHVPGKNEDYQTLGIYRLYKRAGIAGGMSLYSSAFIKSHLFKGYGGVYGGVDGTSSSEATNKYVFYWDCDWLIHDPYQRSSEALIDYENKKVELIQKGVYVFPKGWDE